MWVEPDIETFERLAGEAPVVPVMTEVLLDDATPVAAYRRLRAERPAFLLESVTGGDTWGRYSMLASGASTTVEAHGERVTIHESGATRTVTAADPLGVVRELVRARRPAPLPGLPRFAGGAVGYLGYDVVRRFERLPATATDPLGVADARWMLADTVVVFDNLTHTVKVVHAQPVGGDARADHAAAVATLERTVARLRTPLAGRAGDAGGGGRGAGFGEGGAAPADPAGAVDGALAGFASSMGKERFCRAVGSIRAAIEAGEAIQVVLSHRLSRAFDGDPLDVYRALRVINPSPYMFHLDFGDLELVGASPEVLVRIEGDRMIVRPIAGTRPRGAGDAADRALEEELRADPKERAEHLMLVDLGRNDVGRVARFGSVTLDTFMAIERYSHVMHLVSEVSGTLRPGLDGLDALRAAFPAGTVSGAPKVRAMELIEEHEGERRGVYAGAVGYLDGQGDMDTCIAIRTLLFRDGVAHLQVGAGIVADSVPEREWDETLHKAGATLAAVVLADAGLELAPGRAAGRAPGRSARGGGAAR
jgi:anthranilate synthase component 1